MGRGVDRDRDELVPGVGVGAARRGDRPEQGVEQEQAARDLPAAEVAGGCGPPGVGRERGAGRLDQLGDLPDDVRGDAGLRGGVVERVVRVELAEAGLEPLERRIIVGMLGSEVLLPVPPASDELAVVPAGLDEVVRDGQEDGRLGARPGRDPQVRVGRRVGQAGVEHDQPRAGLLRLDDPLGVGVEVVARLEMGRDQQDHLRVGMVGAGPVHPHPEVIARPPAGRADVRVRVVAVDAPRGEDPLGEAVLAGAADVVHDRVRPLLDDRLPDPAGDVVERLVPGDPLPASRTAFPDPLERVEDPIRVGDLVDGCRALGAVAAARARVLGIALELADLERLLVDVGKQAAGRLAVEAGRRHEHVALLDPLRPGA